MCEAERVHRKRRAVAVVAAVLFSPLSVLGEKPGEETGAKALVLWTSGVRGDDRPVPVGSLQKPFVAWAWSRSHPGATPPRFGCDGGSACWRPSGHGVSGISRALAISCNAYFRRLAADVPRDVLEATFREAGFLLVGPLTPETAIGLPAEEGAVSIRPSVALASYVRLVRTPWGEGEPTRQAVLAGLRDSAWSGTASRLARRGLLAKTGTVPALDGHPLKTSGWVVAVDDSGWACLALLPHGTGREAASALGRSLDRLRPGSATTASRDGEPGGARVVDGGGTEPAPGGVRVALFEALRPSRVRVRNAGTAPVASSRGYVGPGRALSLLPGDRLEEALWDLELPQTGLARRIQGSLECREVEGRLLVVAELSAREYVSGVLRAELPEGGGEARSALGAAVLRFLAAGPRHPLADVCDTTHCAWFVGRGPRVGWPEPRRFVLLAARRASGGLDASSGMDAEAWSRIVAASRQPGPALWTRHCGGQPLSPHFLWGNGDRRVLPCPRHGTPSHPWTRRWRRADLARVLGAEPGEVSLDDTEGIWGLRVGSRLLRYDEAHRLLAGVLGWDALPSPVSRLRRLDDGYEVEGVGSGHRVGLCLGD